MANLTSSPSISKSKQKIQSTIDLLYAYAHTPLYKETIKLTGFSSGDKLYTFIRGFYGLKGLQYFFTKQISTFFRSLLTNGLRWYILTNLLLLADGKQEVFELIKELYKIATNKISNLHLKNHLICYLK